MKTVIEMARGVKATAYTNRHYPDRTTYTFGPEQLEAFAELVRADAIVDEREACAKVADDIDPVWESVSAAIRARGETSLRSNQ